MGKEDDGIAVGVSPWKMHDFDFFTVEVWTPRGLVRYHVLFVIRLLTREVKIAGIVPEPGETWMLQIARNHAFAERYVRTLKSSCLDRMILIGESSLRRALCEFDTHYHAERNHQSLENKIIRPEFTEFPAQGAIQCRERLGGLLR